MTKVKLGLRNLNAIQLISKARHVITQMSCNAHFPAPYPTLADVQLAMEELNTAQVNAMTRDKIKIAIRKNREANLRLLLRHLGNYIQTVSKGDPLIIEASGFNVVKKSGKASLPDQPQSLRSITLDFSGKIKLLWQRVKDAKCYIVEVTAGDPTNPQTEWTSAGYATRSQHTVDGLNPLTYYHFRIVAVGSAGTGTPSEPVRGVALS